MRCTKIYHVLAVVFVSATSAWRKFGLIFDEAWCRIGVWLCTRSGPHNVPVVFQLWLKTDCRPLLKRQNVPTTMRVQPAGCQQSSTRCRSRPYVNNGRGQTNHGLLLNSHFLVFRGLMAVTPIRWNGDDFVWERLSVKHASPCFFFFNCATLSSVWRSFWFIYRMAFLILVAVTVIILLYSWMNMKPKNFPPGKIRILSHFNYDF